MWVFFFQGAPQVVSLCFGLVSLSFAATTTFFVTRERGKDDPDPSIGWAVPPVLVLYLLVVSVNVLTLALIFVYARMWGLLMVLCGLIYSLGGAQILTRATLKRCHLISKRALLWN